jgi:hypothetical protein
VLPAPQREHESRCDYVPWIDDDRAYVISVFWELPLAPEDHQLALNALLRGPELVETHFTWLGDGRFSAGAYDPGRSIGYAAESNDPPTAVRLTVGSSCLLDPE